MVLAPEVARQLGVTSEAHDPRPRALAAAALGCPQRRRRRVGRRRRRHPPADLLDQAMNAVGAVVGNADRMEFGQK